MPKKIATNTEVDIKRLSKENYSYREIKNKLEQDQVDVSISTICRVLNNIGIRRNALNKNQPAPKNKYPLTKRIPEMVKRVKRLVNKENPTTYRDIQNKTQLSLDTISKIIHNDIKLDTRKKSKVHKLTEKNKIAENYMSTI